MPERENTTCPYCGEEMELCTFGSLAAYYCPACKSRAPLIDMDWQENATNANNWSRIDRLAQNAARLRPLQKPLTLEEVGKRLRDVVYVEDKGKPEVIPVFFMRDCISDHNYLLFGRCDATVFPAYHDDMHFRWRAWAKYPTDEERSAAPWKE